MQFLQTKNCLMLKYIIEWKSQSRSPKHYHESYINKNVKYCVHLSNLIFGKYVRIELNDTDWKPTNCELWQGMYLI